MKSPLSRADAQLIRKLRDNHNLSWRSLVVHFWERKGRPQWMVDNNWVEYVGGDGILWPEYSGNQIVGEDLDALSQAVVDNNQKEVDRIMHPERIRFRLEDLEKLYA